MRYATHFEGTQALTLCSPAAFQFSLRDAAAGDLHQHLLHDRRNAGPSRRLLSRTRNGPVDPYCGLEDGRYTGHRPANEIEQDRKAACKIVRLAERVGVKPTIFNHPTSKTESCWGRPRLPPPNI